METCSLNRIGPADENGLDTDSEGCSPDVR
jgi:hypothetical protein